MVDLDPRHDASHLRMFDHLAGPFTGGAVDSEIAIAGNAARVDWSAREPLLVCAPAKALEATALSVRITITPDGGAALPPVVLTFEPYSDRGAFLPAYRPGVDPKTRTAAPFSVQIEPVSGTTPAASLFELRLIEGVLGRLLYLVGAEKQRIVRIGRAIRAARVLAGATQGALDGYGVDLAVPRFREELVYDASKPEPITTRKFPGEREPDAAYRKRLAVFRNFQIATPARATEALRTVRPTFRIVESDAEFAVAMKLMSPGGSPALANYLAYVRDVFLVDPKVPVPANRWISSEERTLEDAMRARLRTAFDWSGAPAVAIAKPLARALDRVGRLRAALGVTRAWKVLAPTNPADSRHELGLGIDLEALPAAEVDALAAAAAHPVTADAETAALAASLAPVPAASDPTARWLLGACGIKTVHPLAGGALFLSHFPMYGMVVDATFPGGVGPIALRASYEAPGDPTRNAVLALALADTTKAWTGPAFAVLSAADQAAAWTRIAPGSAPFVAALASVELRTPANPGAVATATTNLGQVPPELVATLRLDAAQAAALLANAPGAAAQLRQLVDLLGKNGVVSVLVVQTTASEVLIACTETRLPGDASVLNDLRVSSFRWYTVPVTGIRSAGQLQPRLGPRSTFIPAGELSLVVAVGSARAGLDDPRGALEPYSVGAELPDGEVLSLGEYELVMNLLDRLHPMGVVMNTQAIRRAHVDLDGDGVANPLSARLSRTFRPFRHKRHLGDE